MTSFLSFFLPGIMALSVSCGRALTNDAAAIGQKDTPARQQPISPKQAAPAMAHLIRAARARLYRMVDETKQRMTRSRP